MQTKRGTNAPRENSSYKQTFKVLAAFLLVWKCGNTTQGGLLYTSTEQANGEQIIICIICKTLCYAPDGYGKPLAPGSPAAPVPTLATPRLGG